MTQSHFYKKVHFRILGIAFTIYMSFNFVSETFFGLVKITTITVKILVIVFLLSIELYNYITQEQDSNNKCFKGLYPVINKVNAFCSSDSDYIICFQPMSEISKFEFSRGKDKKIFYPLFRSPCLIDGYSVVGYVIKTNITDLNLRYKTCTPNAIKIRDFNKIINHLIAHLEKSKEIQEENVTKLNVFLLGLKNKNSKLFDVFTEMHYLKFIDDNHHLISEILQFWESLNLNKIPICKEQKNNNLKKSKILENLTKINPFFINSLDLKKDKENLEKTLYLFFKDYDDFKKMQMTSIILDNSCILLFFYGCAFTEENLNLDKFTNDFIEILKKIE